MTLQRIIGRKAMKVKLNSIATVQMGLSFRSRLEPDSYGNVSVIQMKDLTEDNHLDNQNLILVDMKTPKEHHRVKANDLAFRSRGQTNTAALIDSEVESAVIAAPLLRIRVNKKTVLPTYLCWFINQPSSQAALQSKATGTSIRMIGKPVLEELEVVLPNLATQKQIVDLDQLSINEQKIMKELSEKKKLLVAGILMRLASKTL